MEDKFATGMRGVMSAVCISIALTHRLPDGLLMFAGVILALSCIVNAIRKS